MATSIDQLRDEVVALTDKLGDTRASLIPILQAVKKDYHGLTSETMQVIAEVLDIHPVEVYSTASFYAFLHAETQGQFVFRLCRTLSCELQGKQAVADALQDATGIGFGETSDDGLFTLEWANCMGMCDQGPALLVNDRVYTRVTPQSAREIVEECKTRCGGAGADCKEEHLV